MKRIKIAIFALALILGTGGLLPTVALADSPTQTVCETLEGGSDCKSTPSNSIDLNKVIRVVINVLSILVGVVSIIMIILGGFKYVTSNGDSNNISSAKNTIIYAIVGLVVVAVAQGIVQFVLNKLK